MGGLNLKGPYLSLKNERETFCVVFTYSIKQAREISNFHVAVVQRRQRNVEKSLMHVQSCCFANIYLLLFCCSRCWRQTSPLYWINLRCKEKEKVVCFTTRQSFQRIPFHERWNKSKFPFKLNWEAKVPEVVFILFYLLFAQRTIGTLKKSTTLPTVKWRLPLTQISSPVKKGENEPKGGGGGGVQRGRSLTDFSYAAPTVGLSLRGSR